MRLAPCLASFLLLCPACFSPSSTDEGTDTNANTDGTTGSDASSTSASTSAPTSGTSGTAGSASTSSASTSSATTSTDPEMCGDGILQQELGEECEDGNDDDTDACVGCRTAICGDGAVWADVEECDDGDDDDGNACKTDCTPNVCGDGVPGLDEECDDANDVETDACRNNCVAAECGDEVIWATQEDCDDGNLTNTDGCKNDCSDARCGDGVTWQGMEACDDANDDNTDSCTTECGVATCGDTYEQLGEGCDDGNTTSNDGCSSLCAVEAFCHNFGHACPSGATQWCLQAECNPQSSTHAVTACEVCMGPGVTCTDGHAPPESSCDHSGAEAGGITCNVNDPGNLPNFAYTSGFCSSWGQTTDCTGGGIGTWCPEN